MQRNRIGRPTLAAGAIAASLFVTGCAGFSRDAPGALQPQAVSGSCEVKKFFLLGFTAVHTDMQVTPGQTCSFTVLNPNLQAFPSAVLVTELPGHGRAEAGLVAGGRSPVIAYTPAPGYIGPDRFTVTIEPNDHAIAVAVAVGRGG